MTSRSVYVETDALRVRVRAYGVDNGLEPIICVHGFPDTSLGYRKVAPIVALRSGRLVLVPDQRGYGRTTFLDVAEASKASNYALEHVSRDIRAVADAFGAPKFYLVGHDWGGTAVFNFAMHFPERLLGVASFCTPFFPAKNGEPPMARMLRSGPGSRFDYQLWFQRPEAVEELNKDIQRTVCCLLRSHLDLTDDALVTAASAAWTRATLNGGMLTKFPHDTSRPINVLENDSILREYVDEFSLQGFFGPLCWYRNVDDNFHWMKSTVNKQIQVPVLMVCADMDRILRPSMTEGMEKHCAKGCRRVVVKNASHWILSEQPQTCADLISRWCARSNM